VQISITGRHTEITAKIKQYAEDKAGRLPRFYDRVQAIEIVVGREAEQSIVEMIVKAAGTQDFVAKEIGPDALTCIDLLVDKMERQLTKHKEKFRNRKHITKKPEPFEEV
jgi:putative sigma-54 modulation protein